MLRDVRLKFLPNIPTCLAWSPDAQLAVAGSEYVIILVPNIHTQQFQQARASVRELIVQAMDEEVAPADGEFQTCFGIFNLYLHIFTLLLLLLFFYFGGSSFFNFFFFFLHSLFLFFEME